MVRLEFVSNDELIAELEKRERDGPGAWTGWQAQRLKVLAEKLNPEPINQ